MTIRKGYIHYAKILGAPVPAYNEGEFEWTLNFVPFDEATKEAMLDDGFTLKESKKEDMPDFFQIKKKGFLKDGGKAKPIKVVDHDTLPWDQETLIGNGSLVNVDYFVQDWEYGKKKGKRRTLDGVQVIKLVPYERKGGFDKVDADQEGENW